MLNEEYDNENGKLI